MPKKKEYGLKQFIRRECACWNRCAFCTATTGAGCGYFVAAVLPMAKRHPEYQGAADEYKAKCFMKQGEDLEDGE